MYHTRSSHRVHSMDEHRNAQTEMRSGLRLASLASFDSHNHIQASRSQSAHVNIAWNTIQDTNYVRSLPQNSTKPRSLAPQEIMGNQSLRMSHAVSCTWFPTKWCGVWSLALLETCCAKLQKNSKCRSYLIRYRRRHETLLSAGGGEDGYASGGGGALTAALGSR